MARTESSNRQTRTSPVAVTSRVTASGRVDIDGTPPVPSTDALLLEIGDFLLLETGDKLLLEA